MNLWGGRTRHGTVCVRAVRAVCTACRYVSLLEASAMVHAATTSPKACQQLQAMCAATTDWRFRFGATSVLMEVVRGTPDAAARSSLAGRVQQWCVL